MIINKKLNKVLKEDMEQGIIETTRNFKNSGIPLDIISENTGLGIEAIV